MTIESDRNWAWKPEKPVRTAVNRGQKKYTDYLRQFGQRAKKPEKPV